ncbi:hypothetical protein DEDE109153_08945 [Deinococcus deserti]|uniref:hypothetical protein n=1 Tax=Deinococcus deserti TaxID=310783 RepID=UPI0001994DF2|nr:hypothetical protein [Deinococcus deserti]
MLAAYVEMKLMELGNDTSVAVETGNLSSPRRDVTDRKRTTSSAHVFRYASVMTARYQTEKAFKGAGLIFRGFHPARRYAGGHLL